MHAMATLDMRTVSLEVMVSMREQLFHAHPDRQSLSIHKGYDDIRMSDPQSTRHSHMRRARYMRAGMMGTRYRVRGAYHLKRW
jgi:hypothetical protein